MNRLTARQCCQLLGLILLLIGLTHSAYGEPLNQETAVSQTLNVVTPSSTVTLPAIDEFATTVMNDPWDMNEPTDLVYYREDSNIANSNFANGFYTGQLTAANGRERITLLTAGAVNHTALRIGKIGYNYPINADHYRYLTFRIFKGSNSCASGAIQWFADDRYGNNVMGFSNSIRFLCNAGWGTYVVDLKTIGLVAGQQPWTGTIRELIIHPFAGAGSQGATVKLDWARLTADDPWTVRPVDVQWTGNGSGGPVTLYASPNDRVLSGDEDVVIALNQSEFGGSFTFQTGLFPPGTYYIAATNGSGTAWSAAPIVINAPPQIEITRPSKTSGVDYATTEKGNAWDMNDALDINDTLPHGWATCVTNESFSGGIYRALDTTCPNLSEPYSDSKLILGHMNPPGSPDPVVDTSKYRYLSFRFRLDGQQNVREGWVSRFGWWQSGDGVLPGSSAVMSRDIVLYEGWNEYNIDLWASDIVDESHPVKRSWLDSAPNRLRIDPSEIHRSLAPSQVQYDWIKLTAMDEVVAGTPFPIEYSLNDAQSNTLTFYYDNDTNGNNGRSFISSITRNRTISPRAASWSEATHTLFLPAITHNATNCVGNCLAWDTSGVPTGIYYVCVEANDGMNSAYRCSEAPVWVR